MIVAVLTNDNNGGYDKNKVAIKTLFKSYGMVFNRGQYMQGKFIWEKNDEKVEAIFTKDDNGVTINARFLINVTPNFENVLKSTFAIIGGQWDVQEKIESSNVNDWKKEMIKEEYRARRGSPKWLHSPLLKPMVKNYLRVKYNSETVDETEVEQIIAEIRQDVDKIIKEVEFNE
jgi:hypothetical protein